ncbi:hypothetical protein DFH08DRAFT_1081084 [Mycena albidolilacea]|uniref:Uncharacterized protein n=1 Tax=Mycena albidolilacea TaxID=1033008 RepID=A0AAD6ZYU5_9AGAR|nr:hypothetical protein DFH08DRAFT_1081084 [Mycena albidolilacea]
MHKKEVVEAVTIIETPPFIFVSVVGYVGTLRDEVKQRFHKNWYHSKKKAFTRYTEKSEDNGRSVAHKLERIRKYCTIEYYPVSTTGRMKNRSRHLAIALHAEKTPCGAASDDFTNQFGIIEYENLFGMGTKSPSRYKTRLVQRQWVPGRRTPAVRDRPEGKMMSPHGAR